MGGSARSEETPIQRTGELSLRDEDGLRAAFAAHGRELFGFALRALGDAGLAEEATQETFVRAWRGADRYDPSRASLRTWLFSIIRHVVLDQLRTRSRQPPPAELPEAEDETDRLDRALLAWQVEEAMRRLGPDHRRVLVETYYRGRPYAEVAAELEVPEGTVKSRVYYALKALKLALEEMGWNDDA